MKEWQKSVRRRTRIGGERNYFILKYQENQGSHYSFDRCYNIKMHISDRVDMGVEVGAWTMGPKGVTITTSSGRNA